MRFQGCNVLPVVTTYHCNIASCVFRYYLHSMYTKCLIYQYLQTLLRIIYICSVGIGIYLEWKHHFTDFYPLSVFRVCLNCSKLTGRWKCVRLLGFYNRGGQSLTLRLCKVERKFYSKGEQVKMWFLYIAWWIMLRKTICGRIFWPILCCTICHLSWLLRLRGDT